LKSDHWQQFRREWWIGHPGAACAFCGMGGPMDLHHLTYERIGHELWSDVVPVHRSCHRAVEAVRAKRALP
jgi:uncharacterized protein CbrC (UPF0167 family)